MSTPLVECRHADQTYGPYVTEVVRTLTEGMQGPIALWQWDKAWSLEGLFRCDNGNVQFDPATPMVIEDFDDVRQTLSSLSSQCDAPCCPSTRYGSTVLAVPLLAHAGRRLLTSSCASQAPAFAESFARLALEAAQRQQELSELKSEFDVFASQISDDFEELSFLRSIARQLEATDLTNDLLSMAKTVLPLLRGCVGAEEMVLAYDPAEQGTAVAPDATDDDLGVALWCGPHSISEQTCLEIVRRYRCDDCAPVVRNFIGAEEPEFAEVRNFIIAPIVKADQLMGWVVAVNRVTGVTPDEEPITADLAKLEFGTPEAGMLSSAASMLASHGRNAELFREREELLVKVVRSLVCAIEAKDPYTCGHSERVALYAKRLAKGLGLNREECEKIYLTGLLHDIGKIGVSDATLRKPGRLTDEEFNEIKQHPDLGWGILNDLSQLRYVMPGVVHHHERVDGKGYPDGLVGDEIPRDGRILAVADAYDAMTSDRPYRQGMSIEKAVGILAEGAGTQWDATMIEKFQKILPDIVKIQENYHRGPRTDRTQPMQHKREEG